MISFSLEAFEGLSLEGELLNHPLDIRKEDVEHIYSSFKSRKQLVALLKLFFHRQSQNYNISKNKGK